MKAFHFDAPHVLHDLKHYLPAQAPLKDFIHHNTLHAFQHLKFHDATRAAAKIFGYKTYLMLEEYRELYRQNKIRAEILRKIVNEKKKPKFAEEWLNNMLHKQYDTNNKARIGALRAFWKELYHIQLDLEVHPILFRVLCSYLDQGISIWNFPIADKGLLAALKEMEQSCFTSFFRTPRAKHLLTMGDCSLENLLKIVVGDETLYEQYLYDQQFAHQGWAGIASAIEDNPATLLDTKKISLHDVIIFELLLEIDALDAKFGEHWAALGNRIAKKPAPLFEKVNETELSEVMAMWQDAFEWSYYDEVLAGVKMEKGENRTSETKTFQAMFCIDDRECSLRRYIEKEDAHCETFGTPGFFGVEFYYQPQNGKFHTKLCPAPVNPKYLIKEIGSNKKQEKDAHFTKQSHSLFRGWLISQTLGFWAALRLFLNIFRPTMSPATASSFKHMDQFAQLSIENTNPDDKEGDLQVGFQVEEMVTRVENLLKSIGLVTNFAPIVYVVGHGASSINNTHYAGYDCGACSGRAGSVNARVICYMANHPKVREILHTRGIDIPAETQFMGALHDTTRDEIAFYDEDALSPENLAAHKKNVPAFYKALDLNAKERSRRFESIDTRLSAEKIHEKVKIRSVSLFEPRPELNHATNTLCVVGRRSLTKNLFLDRRAFMNSYDYQVDPEGKYLFNILKAAAPVCGGINLEYYFSRVDNQKLGAGTKLPHNVMGLIGVANGIDGDLRPGLPSQMIEVHDPIRLMIIVEQYPDVVLNTIQRDAATYEWFINEWVHLTVVNPDTNALMYFKGGQFIEYQPLLPKVPKVTDIVPLLESTQENLAVYYIQ